MNGGENKNFDGGNNSSAPNNERQRHGVIGTRRYRSSPEEQMLSASTNLASNPSTPEFFSQAVIANTAAPQPRKSRKGLIILIISIVLIATIVGVLAFVLNTQNKSNSVRSSFNRFANYLLYGNDSTKDIEGEYEYLNMYQLEKLSSREEQEEYFKNAEQKYKDFYDEYTKTNGATTSALNTYYDDLDLVYYSYKKELLSESGLVSAYVNFSEGDIKTQLNEYYSETSGAHRSSTRDYYHFYAAAALDYLTDLKKLDNKGCVNKESESIITSCIVTTDTNSEISPAMNTFRQLYLDDKAKENSARIFIYGRIWQLKDLVYGNNEEEK